jgi:hypothetical protein
LNQNEMSDFELKSDENAIKNGLMISVGKWKERDQNEKEM